MSAALFEIRLGYDVKLDDAARALLAEASVTPLEFDPEDGQLRGWKAQPILGLDALNRLRVMVSGQLNIERVISNSSTASLERFGQRNTTIENTRCNVAVAGLGLLTVNMVQVENDCCTDRLQGLLNDGWRILAVCVQPDQRRPDYVLGRTEGDFADYKCEPDRPRAIPAPERPAALEIEDTQP